LEKGLQRQGRSLEWVSAGDQLDDEVRIVAGPFVTPRHRSEHRNELALMSRHDRLDPVAMLLHELRSGVARSATTVPGRASRQQPSGLLGL